MFGISAFFGIVTLVMIISLALNFSKKTTEKENKEIEDLIKDNEINEINHKKLLEDLVNSLDHDKDVMGATFNISKERAKYLIDLCNLAIKQFVFVGLVKLKPEEEELYRILDSNNYNYFFKNDKYKNKASFILAKLLLITDNMNETLFMTFIFSNGVIMAEQKKNMLLSQFTKIFSHNNNNDEDDDNE